MLDFTPSAEPTVGIELELQLLDAHTLDLADGIMPLIEFFPRSNEVKPELIQSCVEITSPVCANTASAAGHLLQTLKSVKLKCDELDMGLCAAGAHAFGTRLGLITPTPRFLHMKSEYGILGRNQLTFATHVHVGMPSGNMAMFVMRHLIPCLPVLLAIGANSPFWRGYDTGYASYRHCILAASQNYGLPPYFEDWDNFVQFFRMAQRAAVFDTLRDMHWDVRPNPNLGTLEFRIMDAASTVQTAADLAALIRALVVYLMDHASSDLVDWPVTSLPRWIEQINRYQASLHGLAAKFIASASGSLVPIRELVARLITLAKPVAERIGEARGIANLESFLATGPGYERQQGILRETEDFRDVVAWLVGQLDHELNACSG